MERHRNWSAPVSHVLTEFSRRAEQERLLQDLSRPIAAMDSV